MLDLKTFKSALEQLEEERKIPKEKILEAIEQAMAAAYKKDYGKKGQIIRAKFDLETGKTDFFQVKIVVDESIAILDTSPRPLSKGEGQAPSPLGKAGDEVRGGEYSLKDSEDERVHFNAEHHMLLEDAKKIKKGVELNDEIIFPLESKDDYGRIAAQTAKQVIIQKIREAERTSIIDEYGTKEGEVISGVVQKVERGNVYVDFNRATGILPAEEQIPGEYWERGQRIRAYLYSVEDTPRGINLRLSRTHPKFIEKLFAVEAPEIQNGVVEIKSVAREAGARSKIAVFSNDEHIDAVGSCVGQKGTRVNTVTRELSEEKIDIIPWSPDPKNFVSNSLSPAKVISIEMDEKEHKAVVEVADDQLSLAIGKGGQNVRLAAKLTGWRIDIKGNGKEVAKADGLPAQAGEKVEVEEVPT
ncbi:MAG: NusA antitermination factor [Candidatus Nomurabacteria bacterium GW2011_GWA2_41_25]|uniref:Transcription termination/antitermination protein NusA n=2 Tax=Candidatus Nomuraibacteriota TaxID=1752729 RepID=A0A1F6YA59_9BACT|nr:MAG: NusA antitermination factor [Candidatus Nomurabacteria bacterium GW2011_GWA2_41_25]OGI67614.1 MAG: transcription termination factor NusA [Candidatus Nomurabacteria bacterium RIFCSPHIGHO2_01_FULL_41_91]OGI84792.1 MAG: transcription termination factor NusA [Candidatus Nomurabacteria bacterium RIFCSPHIGHO2_12_FULL_42_19]OGI94271.1 MAG: transcription termination factor NusA [Candidatus Nomurabacteria bacterium RIFCSPLOWO2_01_FULL_41_52]OGI97970.1 MAG: transcription termination factor NusA [